MDRALNRQSIGLLNTVAVFFAFAGCNGNSAKLYDVTGKVTLDNEPLSGALVEFNPLGEGSSASAVTDENGECELTFTAGEQGATEGEYSVYISKTEVAEGESDEGDVETLPRKYNRDTELTARVTSAGPNRFNFSLTLQE